MCQKDERGCPGNLQRSTHFPFSCNECSVHHYTPFLTHVLIPHVSGGRSVGGAYNSGGSAVLSSNATIIRSSSTGSNTVFSASCTEPPCMCHKKHVHHYLTVHHGYDFSTKRTSSHYSARQSSTISQQCLANSVLTLRKPRTATEQENVSQDREINKR